MLPNYLSDLTEFIFIDDIPKKSTVIFIPGSSGSETTEKAAELYRQGLAHYILPSGRYSSKVGYFPDELNKKKKHPIFNTEWEMMRKKLIDCGIPADRILCESQATNTYENALYSKKVIDQMNLKLRKGIIVCKNFHARRATMYYQLEFPGVKFYTVAVEVNGITRDNWFQNERGLRKVMGEVQRIGVQFEMELKKKQK